MSATTVRRMTAMHGLPCAITSVDSGSHAARGRRRFPPPWTVEDHNEACFIVKDRNGYPRWRTCFHCA
jgi:hypothetical protein